MLIYNPIQFVIGQVTPNMLAKLKFGTYIFFGVFCFLMFLWVWFLVPETRNKTLEEIDEVCGDHSGHNDRLRRREIMNEIGLESDSVVTEKAKTEARAQHVEKKSSSR